MITQMSPHAAKAAPSWRSSRRMRAMCDGILHRLPWPGADSPPPLRTLGVTSCHPGEGVTTLAAHLAVAAAAHDKGPVLLVDGNLARPAAAEFVGVKPAPGLAECLRAEQRPPNAIQPSAVENLWVLAGGNLRSSPAGVYDSAGLAALVQELAGEYGLVVFDMPAASQASCLSHLAGLLDGVLLVVEAGRVRLDTVQRVKDLLTGAGARLMGGILNKQRDGAPAWVYRQPR